jgi:hypothetical protein
VLNLARFIAIAKFRPLTWRTAHPYLVRYEGARRRLTGRQMRVKSMR